MSKYGRDYLSSYTVAEVLQRDAKKIKRFIKRKFRKICEWTWSDV